MPATTIGRRGLWLAAFSALGLAACAPQPPLYPYYAGFGGQGAYGGLGGGYPVYAPGYGALPNHLGYQPTLPAYAAFQPVAPAPMPGAAALAPLPGAAPALPVPAAAFPTPFNAYAVAAAPHLPMLPVAGSPQLAPPGSGLVRLPPELAQAQLLVRRELDGNILREDAIFQNDTTTPRSNRLSVTTTTAENSFFGRVGSKPVRSFTKASVDLTILREFPDAIQIEAPREGLNGLGRYAYQAVRQPDGSRCVYAWQHVDLVDGYGGGQQPYAIEYRFCAPTPTAEELLVGFDRLGVGGLG